MSDTNIVLYGYDPLSTTLRPIVTGANGLIVTEQKANSGLNPVAASAYADNSVCGNVGIYKSIDGSVNTDYNTNWATQLRLACNLNSSIVAVNYTLTLSGYLRDNDLGSAVVVHTQTIVGTGAAMDFATIQISPYLTAAANMYKDMLYPVYNLAITAFDGKYFFQLLR